MKASSRILVVGAVWLLAFVVVFVLAYVRQFIVAFRRGYGGPQRLSNWELVKMALMALKRLVRGEEL